jgi:putative FmdB family regulatory protein
LNVFAPARLTASLPGDGGLNCAEFKSRLASQLRRKFSMPTYEYLCEKCGQKFEAFQSMRDEPFRECPKELCRLPKWGHGKVKRLIGTGAGIIFKGSGFYSTDYRSASYNEGAKKETSAPASAEKSSGTKEADGKTTPAPSSAESKPKKESAA